MLGCRKIEDPGEYIQEIQFRDISKLGPINDSSPQLNNLGGTTQSPNSLEARRRSLFVKGSLVSGKPRLTLDSPTVKALGMHRILVQRFLVNIA